MTYVSIITLSGVDDVFDLMKIETNCAEEIAATKRKYQKTSPQPTKFG